MTLSFQRLITLPGARPAAILLALSLVVFAALIPAPAIAATTGSAAPAATNHFTGFCHCSGTFIPDCNTKANCLGAPCLSSPTFC
jgi:hypothetical protein